MFVGAISLWLPVVAPKICGCNENIGVGTGALPLLQRLSCSMFVGAIPLWLPCGCPDNLWLPHDCTVFTPVFIITMRLLPFCWAIAFNQQLCTINPISGKPHTY